MTILATLTHVIVNEQILLIRKKRGFGSGFYNGPGGKIENGENIFSAAIREVKEEIGIIVENIRPSGILVFFFGTKEVPDWIVYVFKTDSFKGEPIPSDEADPEWFSIFSIPYNKMWADDKIWLPLLLNDVKFLAFFLFSKDYKNLRKWIIKSVTEYEIRDLFSDYRRILQDEVIRYLYR